MRVPDKQRRVHPPDGDEAAAGRVKADTANRPQAAFEKLKALRKTTTLGGIPWRELRDCGRP